MKIYYPTQDFNEDTKGYYREYDVADDFPKVADFIYTSPSPEIKYPKFNRSIGEWESDKDKLIADLTQQVTDLQTALVSGFESGVVENG